VIPGARGTSIAYTTDAHSSTISSYVVGVGGKLTLLQSVAASTGAADTDMAIVPGAHQLYVYDAGAHEVQAFGIGSGGTLTWDQNIGSLPASDLGLAGF